MGLGVELSQQHLRHTQESFRSLELGCAQERVHFHIRVQFSGNISLLLQCARQLLRDGRHDRGRCPVPESNADTIALTISFSFTVAHADCHSNANCDAIANANGFSLSDAFSKSEPKSIANPSPMDRAGRGASFSRSNCERPDLA